MTLKADIDLLAFLKAVQQCQKDVYLETTEGDRLNLKSALSQYLFVVLARRQKDLLAGCSVSYCDEDFKYLQNYIAREVG